MKSKTYRLIGVLLLAVLLLSLAAPALAQEPTTAALASEAGGQKTACAAFSPAEQEEFDSLTAMKAADALADADLARYDALAQQMSCYSAQFAAPAQSDQPRGATPAAPVAPGVCDTAGPIEVEGTILGTTPTAYATLGAAFAAINGGTHTGAVSVDVCGDTTETATASLNASGTGSASYTSVVIAPSGGPRTISGSIVGAVIKLTGADNVTIDGRIGGVGRNLTVRNTNTSAATAAIWLTSTGVGAGATNNIIRNLEIAGGATQNTSTNSTFGIILASNNTAISTTSNSDDNDNNSFIANRIVRVRYGLVTRGNTTNLTQNTVVTDNIIGPSSFGADEIGKVGIFMQADQGATVSRNTVQFVGGDFANTTSGADRIGIGIGQESWSMSPTTLTSNTYVVTKNVIHDIVEERTYSAVGLLLGTTGGGSATNNLVANNFIYNVKTNGTSGDHAVGLGISGGHTDTVVFNSISMTGDVDPNPSAAATSNFSSGIRIANTNGTTHLNLTLRNNSVYMDLSSSSTTAVRFYAISGPVASYSFGTGAEDNNNYYINPVNTQLQTGGLGTTSGNTLATQFATLANWQTAYTTPQDAASIQANPNHVSPTSDLHIIGASPNINVAVTIAGVSDDIDGEARPNGAGPDIGADEFYALPGQFRFSSATYAGNEGTTVPVTVERVSGSSGSVTVDYATSDGTATGGVCGTADYVPASGTLTFADSVISQTFNVTLCSDAVVDPLETVNLALSNPTGGASLTTPNTAVLTIGDVPPPFNGTYTVGSGGTYPSLTNDGGIFQAINLVGATGNITIDIISDLTGELGTHALNEIAGGYTLLIKPSGAPRSVTGSINGALIRLYGADGVRIDGWTGATAAGEAVGGNPALRELTIQNTNTGTAAFVIAVQSGANGAQNNTIKNVNVVGQDPTTTLGGIALGGNTSGTVGTDNDGNRVENCSVKRALYGIYSAGQNATNPNSGTVITQNDLSATGADRVRRVGIVVFNENGVQITENSVGGIDTTESVDAIGIGVGTQGVDSSTTTSGGVTNAFVSRNKVNGVNSASTVGFSAVGIVVAGATGDANRVANNMISNVTAPATSPDLVAGIFVVGVAGSTTQLYYNSVAMTGDRGTVTGQMPSYGLAVTGTDPALTLRNNIFYTTQTASGGGAAAESYAVGLATTTFVNLDSNYNAFYSSGANDGGFRTGSLSTSAGTDHTALSNWQTAVSDDANSIEADPSFVNPVSDLHITGPSSPVSNAGAVIAGITIDFDGDTRSTVSPDIGADEFLPLAVTLASFTAQGFSDRVLVEWMTVSEYDNAGFNLYRSDSAAGPQALLAYVPSQGPGSTQGFAYSYDDLAVQPGQTWWYWLEDVSLSGATTLHGPVSATVQAPTAVTLSSVSATPAAAGGALLPWLLAAAGASAGAALALGRRRR